MFWIAEIYKLLILKLKYQKVHYEVNVCIENVIDNIQNKKTNINNVNHILLIEQLYGREQKDLD